MTRKSSKINMKATLTGIDKCVEIDLIDHRNLVLELSDGSIIEVELFERREGKIAIRTINGARYLRGLPEIRHGRRCLSPSPRRTFAYGPGPLP